jgi:uncharacterized damage-inducible protein DinB
MTISEMLLPEFDQEMASTRKMLECVPDQKFGWEPDEKSSTLGKLANHVAMMPFWVAVFIDGQGKKPSEAASKVELLECFDKYVTAARSALSGANDDRLSKTFPVTPTLSKPLWAVLRNRVISHLIHHRGQLSVYLRLLGVPVPGMYGPSADEKS